MSKERSNSHGETTPVGRYGFLEALGVARDTLRNTYPTGFSLAKALQAVRDTEVPMSVISSDIETNLDHAAAAHIEHDEFTVTRVTEKDR